jgi:hypothetical protein
LLTPELTLRRSSPPGGLIRSASSAASLLPPRCGSPLETRPTDDQRADDRRQAQPPSGGWSEQS